MHHNFDISTRIGRKNATLAAIAVTFTLLLVVFAILLCMNVASLIKDRVADDETEQPNDQTEQTPDTPTTPTTPDLPTVTLPASAISQGTLILVNSSHVYQFPATEEHLTDIYAAQRVAQTLEVYYQLSGSKLYMESNAYQAMNKLLTAFCESSGRNNVLIKDAYRSYDQQNQLYQSGGSTAPGYSDSHTGLSCALKVKSGSSTWELNSSDTYDWIYENCYKYGFIVRYPADKTEQTKVSNYDYYFRYVGYVHAVAHTLGGKYGVAHGLANAVLLPTVLRAYGESAVKPLAELAKAIGFVMEDVTDADAAERFISKVEGEGEHRRLAGDADH